MSLESAVKALQDDPRLREHFVDWRVLPAEAARYGDWPSSIDARLLRALRAVGIDRPYTHQAAAIEGAVAGRDQVVVTPTASGKSLCYMAPVLNAVLRDPSARALFLFPTKALAQDQLHELHALVTEAEVDVKTFTYDGDTAPSARRAVRTAGHVVITNPDMLHTGILPHHPKWVRLFENLRYVVIDELHMYRGVFGSHMAQVLRRLQRICRFYGSDPVFLCSSATIANPAELAAALIGREVALIDDNGAPRGERLVTVFNPPIVNRELGIRRGIVNSVREIATVLQENRVQTIVFARSRQRVELLTQYLRNAETTKPGRESAVRGYRSGYLPSERRRVEAGLRSGEIRTVVTTNALELGIDIGGLDASVLAGYPGTVASLRQQMGRAGRGERRSLSILVAGGSPLDQFVATHPTYLFGESVEAGLINPENRIIAAEHLKCAVFELPLEDEEHDLLGRETGLLLDALDEDGTVYRRNGRAYWSSDVYPAQEVSLRNADGENVVIIEQGSEARVIGEVDRPSAMTLVHEDAIYIHDGQQYHVDELDWDELKAYVRPVDVDYYTDAHVAVDLKVLDEWESEARPVVRGHGEVAVSYLATIFKKIKLHTHENVGWGSIRLPQDDLQTSAFWLALPASLTRGRSKDEIERALSGIGQLLLNVAPVMLMCDAHDLRLAVQIRSVHTRLPTVFLWEAVPGGVGLSEHLYENSEALRKMALSLVSGCDCGEGCPACVGPPEAGIATKDLVMETLRAMRSRGATDGAVANRDEATAELIA